MHVDTCMLRRCATKPLQTCGGQEVLKSLTCRTCTYQYFDIDKNVHHGIATAVDVQLSLRKWIRMTGTH